MVCAGDLGGKHLKKEFWSIDEGIGRLWLVVLVFRVPCLLLLLLLGVLYKSSDTRTIQGHFRVKYRAHSGIPTPTSQFGPLTSKVTTVPDHDEIYSGYTRYLKISSLSMSISPTGSVGSGRRPSKRLHVSSGVDEILRNSAVPSPKRPDRL